LQGDRFASFLEKKGKKLLKNLFGD
jgi:hypothetical protein